MRTENNITIFFRSKVIAKKLSKIPRVWNFSRVVYARIRACYRLIGDNQPNKYDGNDATSCFRYAFIEVRIMPEYAAYDGFVCIKSNVASNRLQISRVKNIGNVSELSGVPVSSTPPYAGLLV